MRTWHLAKLLWVTEQTIKFHLSNIYRKLGVSNRTEAAPWAQLHGLLSEPSGEAMAGAPRHLLRGWRGAPQASDSR